MGRACVRQENCAGEGGKKKAAHHDDSGSLPLKSEPSSPEPGLAAALDIARVTPSKFVARRVTDGKGKLPTATKRLGAASLYAFILQVIIHVGILHAPDSFIRAHNLPSRPPQPCAAPLRLLHQHG